MTDNSTAQKLIDGYLAAVFADADLLGLADDKAVAASSTVHSVEADREVLRAGREILTLTEIDWRRMASLANRDFQSEDELRLWLEQMLNLLEGAIAQKPSQENSNT